MTIQHPDPAHQGRGTDRRPDPRTRPMPAGSEDGAGPIPPENQPGHHPEVEQDKPQGPPPGMGGNAGDVGTADEERHGHTEERTAGDDGGRTPEEVSPRRFRFEFEPSVALPAALFGVCASTAEVVVDGGSLRIRFGPWRLQTTLDNVADAVRTGPYSYFKVAGPPHLSLSDRGITFATTTAGGVCIRFRRPVGGVFLPSRFLAHPGATVTVEEADELLELLSTAKQASS